MSDPAENEQTPQAAGADSPPPAVTPAPVTGERVLHIALGAAATFAQAAERAARDLSQNGPVILETLEERGKPVRAALAQKLGGLAGGVRATTATSAATATGEAPAAPHSSADAEIAALERRVRELEQEVSRPATPPADDETTAEAATTTPEHNPSALADSPYAVSETEDEVAHEEGAGPTENAA